MVPFTPRGVDHARNINNNATIRDADTQVSTGNLVGTDTVGANSQAIIPGSCRIINKVLSFI